MPEEMMKFMPDDRLMSAEEIVKLIKTFNELGVHKVRFTGGEPTLRKDLPLILKGISKLDLELSITTNGFQLEKHLDYFKKFGLKKINVSLDSIRADSFFQITRRDSLYDVVGNIKKAIAGGFEVKINVVVIRNVNDHEMPDLVNWASELGLPIRFIEYMPFFGNEWEYDKVFSRREMLDLIGAHVKYHRLESATDSTSEVYQIENSKANFGIIPTVTNPFCQGCSRLRLTADGKIKNCLFSGDEDDILSVMRRGEEVKEIILQNLKRKKKSAAGRIDFSDEKAKIDYSNNRSMIAIGG
jgi:cyclic pyranopterin phosphate synthase